MIIDYESVWLMFGTFIGFIIGFLANAHLHKGYVKSELNETGKKE